MREIKFRTWHNNGWIYFGVEGVPKEIENDIDYTLVYQFTGLNDCNGKEIYEGDIIRVKEISKAKEIVYNNKVVEFIDGSFGISTDGYDLNDWSIVPLFIAKDVVKSDIEIIGNVYENPELLEYSK